MKERVAGDMGIGWRGDQLKNFSSLEFSDSRLLTKKGDMKLNFSCEFKAA